MLQYETPKIDVIAFRFESILEGSEYIPEPGALDGDKDDQGGRVGDGEPGGGIFSAGNMFVNWLR